MCQSIKLREVLLTTGIALSLGLMTGSVYAFTPDPVPTAPSTSQMPGKPQTPAELADPYSAGKSKGTDITIPGIGSVGAIPKLDFGLELLYGNNNSQSDAGLGVDQGSRVQDQSQRLPDNDVQIKGTFSHKF